MMIQMVIPEMIRILSRMQIRTRMQVWIQMKN